MFEVVIDVYMRSSDEAWRIAELAMAQSDAVLTATEREFFYEMGLVGFFENHMWEAWANADVR